MTTGSGPDLQRMLKITYGKVSLLNNFAGVKFLLDEARLRLIMMVWETALLTGGRF